MIRNRQETQRDEMSSQLELLWASHDKMLDALKKIADGANGMAIDKGRKFAQSVVDEVEGRA